MNFRTINSQNGVRLYVSLLFHRTPGVRRKDVASAVREAKKRHPEITLTLLLPYHPHDQLIPVPEGFDGTFYPPGMETVPKWVAIVRANRYMLEHSSYLIAYVSHPSSGSREVLEAALRRQKHGLIHVTNLAGWYPI